MTYTLTSFFSRIADRCMDKSFLSLSHPCKFHTAIQFTYNASSPRWLLLVLYACQCISMISDVKLHSFINQSFSHWMKSQIKPSIFNFNEIGTYMTHCSTEAWCLNNRYTPLYTMKLNTINKLEEQLTFLNKCTLPFLTLAWQR